MSQKTVVDGITFDSKKEAWWYLHYRAMERNGEIINLERQIPFPVQINGKHICKYFADFVYTDNKGNRHVIDVKSKMTEKLPVFRLKKKLVEALYNIEIEIVM